VFAITQYNESREKGEKETKNVFPLLAHQEDKERAIDFLAEQKIAIYCDNNTLPLDRG